MRSLVDGLSYNQIVAMLTNISILIPPEVTLVIADIPSKYAIRRCYIQLAIMVKIDATEPIIYALVLALLIGFRVRYSNLKRIV